MHSRIQINIVIEKLFRELLKLSMIDDVTRDNFSTNVGQFV
jgi:hypothetical protein